MQTTFPSRTLRRGNRGIIPGFAALVMLAPLLAAGNVSWRQVLGQPPDWYEGPEAIRIADNVLLYQRSSGGWPKNIDMATDLPPSDRQRLIEDRSRNDAGIDNGATTTQVRYLAHVATTTHDRRFESACLAGLDYLLDGQYPNGGWPQFFPNPRGYSAHVTFNDNAMVNVLTLLRDIADERPGFAFIPSGRRTRAADAIASGVNCILRCQVVVDGRRTVWCAQHDERTLAPAPARSYEKISLSGSESVGIVRFLMSLEHPSADVRQSIEAAVAWFEASRITGIRQVRKPDPSLPGGYDKVIVAEPDAPPLWARFYEIGTNRPTFCGRDGVIKYTLAEIEHERRVGYSWYGEGPKDLLTRDYPAWKQRVAPAPSE
ncbi:MAG: pectate lyase [Verrucomicrobiales bacterium]|nr:pectate lyase [Verrucomicrobiales bacterium]